MQIKIGAAAALALLAITTAATAVQFGDYRTTGFLSDYSKLRHKPGTDAYSLRGYASERRVMIVASAS